MKIFIKRCLWSGYREEIKENEVKGESEGERRGWIIFVRKPRLHPIQYHRAQTSFPWTLLASVTHSFSLLRLKHTAVTDSELNIWLWVCVQLTQPFWVHFLTCQMRHMQIHWHGWDAEETGFKPREVPLALLKGLAKGLGGILGEGSCFQPAPTGEPSVWAAMGASVPGTEQGAWGLRKRLGAQSLQETTQSRNLSPLHSLNEVIQRRKPNQPMFYAWSGLASSSRSPREVLF